VSNQLFRYSVTIRPSNTANFDQLLLFLEAEFGMSVYNLSEIWQESSAEYKARISQDSDSRTI